MRGVAASTGRISWQSRLDLSLRDSRSPAPLVAWRRSLIVIETFRLFPHDPAADETLERTQRSLIFRRNEADRITDGMRAAGASDAMDIILRVHREIVIHHMRDPIDIDAARGDIGRDQHAHRARLEIFQSAQPLILRTIRMDRAGLDSAALEPARDLGPRHAWSA